MRLGSRMNRDAAAPATVTGKDRPHATGKLPGRRACRRDLGVSSPSAEIRKPGDLPARSDVTGERGVSRPAFRTAPSRLRWPEPSSPDKESSLAKQTMIVSSPDSRTPGGALTPELWLPGGVPIRTVEHLSACSRGCVPKRINRVDRRSDAYGNLTPQ